MTKEVGFPVQRLKVDIVEGKFAEGDVICADAGERLRTAVITTIESEDSFVVHGTAGDGFRAEEWVTGPNGRLGVFTCEDASL